MKHVWSITVVLVVLSLISVFNILSLGISSDGEIQVSDMFVKHSLYILFGWLIYLVFLKVNYWIFKFFQTNLVVYILTLFLLISTLIWGPVINNTQRWLVFGDFQFQPSELAKVAIILFIAFIFSLRGKVNEWSLLSISFLFLLPFLAIVYIQPHGSMSIILFLLWFGLVFTLMPNQARNVLLLCVLALSFSSVLTLSFGLYPYFIIFLALLLILSVFIFYARDSLRKILGVFIFLGFILGMIAGITWHSFLHDYQKERIYAFFDPVETAQDVGFNVDQSRIAIGSGELFGKGWGFGTQSKLQFLPEYQTDFIFASFSEEFGFVGSILIIFLYGFLIFRILIFSQQFVNMNFEFAFLIGVSIKLLLEVFVNIGTNTGVIPATGIPLPIMSYGGSNIFLTFFSLALVQGIISNNIDDIEEKRSFNIDNS